MAKKQGGRMRVFFAELEGDDETMQAGLRAIAATVSKTVDPRAVVLRRQPVDALPRPGVEELDDFEEVEAEEEEFADSMNGNPRPRRSRKPPSMTLVKDLDLHPEGKPSLREFVEKLSLKNQAEYITVFVYYLSRELELEGITPNHVFTCFREVGKKSPIDTPQAIRGVAHRKGFVDSASQSDIKITTKGENFVAHDLPERNGHVD